MNPEQVLLPDGRPFCFWEDQTQYTHSYHVAQNHPQASDDNPGTQEKPFKTINQAAFVLKPGEKVIVHAGVYRECVQPVNSGSAEDAMICYQAAAGETVSIRGSETFQGGFTPSVEFSLRQVNSTSSKVWRREFPVEWFMGYNPLIANNMTNEYTTFNDDWKTEEILVQQLRRVLVFADGRPLKQVNFYYQLGQSEGTFWVEDPGLAIHVRLWNDADPNELPFEITTREQVFTPKAHGLGYIRVDGFTLEYCADGVPVPQHALISAFRGHHWIIENNEICHANSTGIDVGNETWHAAHKTIEEQPRGGHIIRNNHIHHCGFCGIAGVGNVDGVLVEHNLIEYIGREDIERIWESAGLKMHTTIDLLIRRNVFQHIRESAGIWLDYLNENSRITENVFYDLVALHPAIYVEVSHAENMVDHNLIWQASKPRLTDCYRYSYGTGINADSGEKCTIANNFVGEIGNSYAITCDLVQAARIVNGRVGQGTHHKIFNNIVYHAAKRVLLSKAEGNLCDGNLYHYQDEGTDAQSFCVQYPAPEAVLTLSGWQEFMGFDLNGKQHSFHAKFDPKTLELEITLPDEIHAGYAGSALHPALDAFPGIRKLQAGKNTIQLNAGLLKP